jgi:outer membrane immunogenic protein
MGGGQVGYDMQAGSTVFGVVLDFQGSSQRDNQVCQLTCLSPATSYAAFDQRMEWFGTARGRVGYAIGSTLFYATGGFAYGGIKTRISGDVIGSPFDSTFSHEKTGYAAGAGIESPLTFLGLFGPQWTISGEYLFVDLGRITDSVSTAAGSNLTYSTRVQEHIFRTGINYHFNQPVVAKY